LALCHHRRNIGQHLSRGQRLAHHVGANGVFTDLLAAGRTTDPAGQLEVWWSARRCAAEWGRLVRPDGYGVWVTAAGRRLPFLLEHDMGTERLPRLAAKLDGYADLAAAAGHPTQILFTFPTNARELAARAVLTAAALRRRLPVAAAVSGASSGTVWLPLNGRRRMVLGELPDVSEIGGVG